MSSEIEFEPRFKSAKTQFKLIAGLNLETNSLNSATVKHNFEKS